MHGLRRREGRCTVTRSRRYRYTAAGATLTACLGMAALFYWLYSPRAAASLSGVPVQSSAVPAYSSPPNGPSAKECTDFRSVYNSEVAPLSDPSSWPSDPSLLMQETYQGFYDLSQVLDEGDSYSRAVREDAQRISQDAARQDYQKASVDLDAISPDVQQLSSACG